MKLCRYNDDRLGLVINSSVHDVTPLQDEIIGASRYAMQGDAVIAALGPIAIGWRPWRVRRRAFPCVMFCS